MLNLQGASIDEFFKDKEHALYLTANQLLRSKLWGTFQFISPNSGSGGAGAGGCRGSIDNAMGILGGVLTMLWGILLRLLAYP